MTTQTTIASTTPQRSQKIWAGAILLISGLGLILLSGCFFIGIWMIVGASALGETAKPVQWSMATSCLVGVLYGVAFLCLLGAAVLLTMGLRGMLAVIRG